MLKVRKSRERGFFNHGWLQSFHTFSFASYFDRNHMNFGNLRVINEDVIAAGAGFGSHPHNNMEIITYIISGSLSHQDSMGNSSTISAGEFQVMSAGTGVFHSEFNQSQNLQTHLLQIWISPKKKQIPPRYDQKSFLVNNDLTLVVSGSGREGSLQINQDAEIFLGKFQAKKEFNFAITPSQKIWVQVISGKIIINCTSLETGDAAAIENETSLEFELVENSEFLVFVL